jgi:hypothetical protein
MKKTFKDLRDKVDAEKQQQMQLQQQQTKMKQESSFQRPPQSFKPEQRIPRKIRHREFNLNTPSKTKSRVQEEV